ncbi:MAG: neutral/alkaline non-lysosomal ceramidase N-terminal domain-containing protein [Aeromicrobium sp.]|uniref:neutral/alkaline non-lysosomal ceramidase N-terminal domain-containing protein n=1 Tax=Aeromicrobium sp. TaxID=1871063 RepID=UPI0039E28B8B
MSQSWAVGRGLTDITGEPWGVGMMGYGMPDQRTVGLLSRQYARAFVLEAGGDRVAYVVADIGMFFHSSVTEILRRLAERFGDLYTARNVVLTATHTHCGPGGHSTDILYNITTAGFHQRTFERLVAGVVEAVAAAHDDLAPAEVSMARGELRDASANRARAAFERNPAAEKAMFPDGIDPAARLLRIERDGSLAGAVHWFGVHNTSMTNQNRLISADNKGLAAWTWERELDGRAVTAFAQTNAGDLSPNLDLQPGTGPTDDERENTRIIAERQLDSARALAEESGETLTPVVRAVSTTVRLAHREVEGRRTGRAILGASFAAGKLTDGPGSPLFHEGRRNTLLRWVSRLLYQLRPDVGAAHAPKELFLPVGSLGWVQETYPLQVVQLGELCLVCLPFEVTVVSGLRIRRAVAAELGVDVESVVLQGYANGYGHYVTTPQEYQEQLYEGGSTIFGACELAALTEEARVLARSLGSVGMPTPDPHPAPRPGLKSPVGSPRWSRRGPISVASAPTSARVGETVVVEFRADHPNAVLRPTYLEVERDGEVIATDADPSTSIRWSRDRRWRWRAEVTWRADSPGRVSISYLGRSRATAEILVV